MQVKSIIQQVKLELKPGMGCTEPAAIGLAVSRACIYLDREAEYIRLKLSSAIFKNAFSVKLPNSNKAGVPLAAALGFLLAKPDDTLEIFSGIDDGRIAKAEELLAQGFVEVQVEKSERFLIQVEVGNNEETVRNLTLDQHDNLVFVEKNGAILLDARTHAPQEEKNGSDITDMTIRELVAFCEEVDLELILFLQQAVDMNAAISQEGLTAPYGLGVGRGIQEMIHQGLLADDMIAQVKIAVAAASDCRMGGGKISVMTVLGSGNQGLSAILPAATVARYLEVSQEKMLRAVLMSILLAMYMKYQVGRLSPICGVQLTGVSSAAAIAWLLSGNVAQVEGAMQNMLGNLTGMICDGAKDGCALKLAECAGAAVVSARLALSGNVIQPTDGIVCGTVEDSIRNVARLSKEGMAGVDDSIIEMLLQKQLS